MRNQLVMIILNQDKQLAVGDREAWSVHAVRFDGTGCLEAGDAAWMDSRNDAIEVAEFSL